MDLHVDMHMLMSRVQTELERQVQPIRQKLLASEDAGAVSTADSDEFSRCSSCEFGSKSIGLIGGIMLLSNNLAGPTISLMPGLTQEAGWLPLIMVQVLLALLSAVCAYMLVAAIRAIPGNEDFQLRVEFTDVVHHYMSRFWFRLVMLFYHGYLMLTLITYIIQSAQVIDYFILDVFGASYGLEFGTGGAWLVRGTNQHSSSPFSPDSIVLSSSVLVCAAICVPFSLKNLDENITLQYGAMIAFTILAVVWVCFLTQEEEFPRPLPLATGTQMNLVSTLLFNFAFLSALPSWLNEKKPDVPLGATFGFTMGFVVVLYSVIGIVGGLAFRSIASGEDLFSKLNSSGSFFARATVGVYPVVQNFTSIPVFSVLLRYNSMHEWRLGRCGAAIFSVLIPWVASVPFYTGRGFQHIADMGGLWTSSVINFAVPAVLYLLLLRRRARNVVAASDAEVSVARAGDEAAWRQALKDALKVQEAQEEGALNLLM